MKEMTIREIQMVSLDILKDVHEFCVEHDIKYSLYAGTLIGAIRHQGFIPWDDDIDIVFPRPEYEKFVKMYRSKNGYKLFCRERQGDGVFLAYARLCDMERTYVDDSYFPWTKEKKGVWIDLLPLDGAEENLDRAKTQLDHIYKVWDRSKMIRRSMRPFNFREGIWKLFKLLIGKIVFRNKNSIFDKHISLCKEIPFDKSKSYNYFCWTGFKMKGYYKTSAFSSYLLKKFEDSEFYVMADYDGVLRTIYGDYMELPPEEDRIPRHNSNKFYWK